jgi:uncharacterized protein
MAGAGAPMAPDMQEVYEFIPSVETHLIPSKYVKQTFKIQVMQPARQRGLAPKFPVVYATDGNFAFDVLKGISFSMQASGFAAPRFILVGIGYPSDSPEAGSVLRARDLTFPGYPQFSTKPPPVEGVLVADEGTKDFFGGQDFQQFIEEELIPHIDDKYQTVRGDRTYFGHSAGGSFGLFTVFTKSHLFRNYIISSAGLVCHGELSTGIRYENYDFLLQDARRFIASGKSLCGIRVYLSVGTEEEFESAYAPWQLTSSFYRLSGLLKAALIPGLNLTTQAFPGETHMTVWPLAFTQGIQAVFGSGVRSTKDEIGLAE